MDNGWIKLHRKICDWEWYSDHNTFRVFIYLLLHCNFEPHRFRGYDVPIGSGVFGLISLAENTGLSVRSVRTALTHLKSTNEVTIKTTSKFSIISIVKWDDYQQERHAERQTSDKQSTSKRQASDNTIRTKEDKNGRNEEYIPRPADVSIQVWEDFIKLRKQKRSPLTETAIHRIAQEAGKVGWTLEQALTECCARGWQGFKATWIEKEKTNGQQKSDDKKRAILAGLGLIE